MKNIFTFLLLLFTFTLSAQEADRFVENTSDRPRDPRSDQMNFVPNEVLVKFKDDVVVSVGTTLKSAGISSIDQVLRANRVASLEKLFPSETKLKSARIVKDPQGRDMKIPSLHNIYRITVPQLKSTNRAPADIFKFMEEMKALPEVEYAEPNYIFTIGDFTPAGREMTMLEAMEQTANSELSKTATGLIPNDPLYNSQWGIPATNIDKVWNTTTGDSTAIIAILDTGVDWKHPDLAANIWKNKQEIPDNGIDDDGNGLIDDIRGWDFINNDNNPMDDNSHGTHVAGIAAAVGNNGIGIAGVNWRAKIMPIKVFQSSGKGDAATIAKGITYAASKGATVINMSFGSYTESLTMKNALASAYATAVLVAAAGNDVLCIGPGRCPDGLIGAPMYPGAYSFVLGVEANAAGGHARFSNFDQDGPVFSEYSDLFNYELKAPGVSIISCVPGGNYREYNGTSMAAPLVAGAVSLYRKQRPNESQELLFGNLINSINQNIDLEAALNIIPEPKLNIVSYAVTDTIDGDHDGRPDAGETIELKVKVRNSWGQANDVKVGIEFGEFEDHSTATILNSEASIGVVSAYATLSNTISLKLKIDSKVPNNRDIVFNLKSWYGSKLGLVQQQIILNVENATELTGVLSSTKVLTPDKFWLISGSFKIAPTGILILKPGTHLFIKSSLINDGLIIGIGKPDSIIYITGTSIQGTNSGKLNLKYTEVELENQDQKLLSCIYSQSGSFELSQISLNSIAYGFYMCEMSLKDCLYYNSDRNIGTNKYSKTNFDYVNDILFAWNIQEIKYCNFIHTNSINATMEGYRSMPNFQTGNNILTGYNSPSLYAVVGYNIDIPNQYWGTNNSNFIEQKLYDFNEDGRLAKINFTPYLNQPSDSAHAIVWKVLVNGKDAQDEVVDPVGVGKLRFDVYFNRPMDKTIIPQVSFGVKTPFNQQLVNEDRTWSSDGRIFTVYKTINLTTGDGINRIRVAGAKEINGWDFEIPVEDQRFEFVVSASNSASMDFMATPSLGKVSLEWNNNDLADGLGFNMYRMENVNDSVLTKPILVNKTLIADTLFTDFTVTPNKKYYYYYKILRTNLTETDSSKVVSAIPFTASKGDANGDLAVNVLDITTIVSYLLNNNPQPFIFEAADLNSDGNINVLDIVGVVNLVLGNKSAVIATSEQVKLYMQNDTLFADAPIAVGGIQFDISGVSSVEEIQKLKALDGFESGYSANDKGVRLLYYSLSGKSISAGTRIPLLRLKKGSGVSDAIFANKIGTSIPVNYDATGVWNLSDKLNESVAELGQNFPNPLSLQTTIPIRINEPVDEAVVRIVNMFGQTVKTILVSNPTVGEHLLQWNSGANKGFFAYLLEIKRGKQQFICPVRKMIVQ